MGWLFGWNTRKALADHLIEGNGVKTIKSCWKGNNLWAVQEYTYGLEHPTLPGKTIRYIALYLCKGPAYGNKNDHYGWGYKDMDESCGPYYYNCPISYIEQVEAHESEHCYEPLPNAFAWRAAVRTQHAKATRKLIEGQKIKLYGHEYTVGSKHWKSGYVLLDYDINYRLKRSQIKDVEVLG